MDELGQILRQARENKGLTLAQAEDATRINARFLEALETGDYTVLPTPVHVRGFLRNYARFLGLDPEPLLERYQPAPFQTLPPNTVTVVEQGNPPTPDKPLSTRLDQPFFMPVNLEVTPNASSRSDFVVRLIIVLAAIVSIGLIVNRFVPFLSGNGDGTQALTEGINEIVQQVTNNAGGTAVTPTNQAITPSEIVTSTERVVGGTTFETPVPLPTPTRPPLPPTLEEIKLRLDIDERTWMEVTIDGDVVFSGIARPGDSFEWTATEEARVLTGNAIGIFATINDDIIIGRLGGRGENKEEIWRTTN
ncbi:MAG: DUF4115 domain-containing protein [Candidatus Promineifilaceae bacterium]